MGKQCQALRKLTNCPVKEQSIKVLYFLVVWETRGENDYCSFKGIVQEKEGNLSLEVYRDRMPAELEEPTEAPGIAGEMEESFS